MPDTVSDLARRLAENAEAVCRHYLSNGRRAGGYWLAGDVQNSPGRSLYVRLRGPTAGRGAAGKWTDAATGERGDLLDLIAARRLHGGNAPDEARRFLGLVRTPAKPPSPVPAGSPEAARRLFAMSRPIADTLAEAYLRGRGIQSEQHDTAALRFHPHCFYRPDESSEPIGRTAWPAMIAAVTGQDGGITGLQHTWLDPAGGKAPVPTPRRAMGHLLGHAVRFGRARDTMAAGEGIETVLSLRSILPAMPMAAALSAGHLRRLPAPAGPAPALHRARPRPGRTLGGRQAVGPGAGGRDRGDRAGADQGRLQRRPAAARSGCAGGQGARAARHGGRKPVLATVGAGRTDPVSLVPARRPGMDGQAWPTPAGEPRPRPSERAIGPEAARAGNG